jgi:transcriptional regulator of NAD metabolism
MTAKERRNEINNILAAAEEPVSASMLAQGLNVSRQIIVGDVALLRAAGVGIIATPRGYILTPETTGVKHTIACLHSGNEAMEAELNLIVDCGCSALDVIVDHPVYGQLTGQLSLSSRYDVEQFKQRMEEANAMPLSTLTEGIHLHTISCPNEAAFQRVKKKLRELGILLE